MHRVNIKWGGELASLTNNGVSRGADCGVKGQFSISNVNERFQVQRANDSSEEFPIEMRERGKTLNYNAQLIHDLLPKH